MKMTKKTMRTKRTVGILFGVLGVFLLFYIAYQVYMFVSPSYKTEVALITTISDSISARGIVVRDETVIETDPSLVLGYLIDDGDKVASGASVAEIFGSADDAMRDIILSREQALAKSLDGASAAARSSGANIDSIQNQIYGLLSSLNSDLSRQDYTTANATALRLIEQMASFSATAGTAVDLSAGKAQADARVAALAGVTPTGIVTTPSEGYFISSTDGYETLINKSGVLEQNAADLEALLDAEAPARRESDCKVVYGYKWYFAVSLPGEEATRFAQGDTVSIDFNYALVNEIPMTVVKVIDGAKSGHSTIVFECGYLNPSLCKLRIENARVNFSSFTGIKIDRTALRLENGKLGVYIKYGNVVEFRSVNKIYETDDYIISEPSASDPEILSLYDEMIVQGRDIKVGKTLGRVNVF